MPPRASGCFAQKDALKPFLGETHNTLWRATGFINSLRVPENYDGLLALVAALGKYLDKHPEQANATPQFNVTMPQAEAVHDAMKAANDDLNPHDDLIATNHSEQEKALEDLRAHLRGLVGELEQNISTSDSRWRRFGFHIPDEPKPHLSPFRVFRDFRGFSTAVFRFI